MRSTKTISRSKKKRNSSALLIAFLLAAAFTPLLTPRVQAKEKPDAPYALLFGTVFDASNRAVYGATIKIRRADQKKPKWELISDHSGEFAQRVPAGQADYIVTAELKDGKKRRTAEAKVHVENDERQDFSLHLTE